MKRKVIRNKRIDSKVFENTANRIHKKNLNTKYNQGGIRL